MPAAFVVISCAPINSNGANIIQANNRPDEHRSGIICPRIAVKKFRVLYRPLFFEKRYFLFGAAVITADLSIRTHYAMARYFRVIIFIQNISDGAIGLGISRKARYLFVS